jgi:hypothetical protein
MTQQQAEALIGKTVYLAHGLTVTEHVVAGVAQAKKWQLRHVWRPIAADGRSLEDGHFTRLDALRAAASRLEHSIRGHEYEVADIQRTIAEETAAKAALLAEMDALEDALEAGAA